LALQDGLSFGVKLILSEKNKILVIPKEVSIKNRWKVAVCCQRKQAVRRNIKLGRENPSYEVLEED
jgi:HlyD family secretion protein